MSVEVDISQIEDALARLDSEASPSEMHGALCGLLCGRSDIDAHEWLSLTTDAMESIEQGDLLAREASETLTRFFLETYAALSDSQLNFHPLLTDEESDDLRLEAIAQWAQGFLMGLSLAGIKQFSDYPEEVQEFVEAMTSISNAQEYELSGDESDEEAIMELIEFIRIGTLLVNEEMNPVRVPVDIPVDETLH